MKNRILAAVAIVALARGIFATTGFIFDDALITARYGAVLAETGVASYNPGEPASWGFTSPAWLALAWLGSVLRLPLDILLPLVGVACDLALTALVARSTGLYGTMAFTAVMAGLPMLNRVAVGGMESPALTLLVGWWWLRGSGWAAALAPLVRPEGWLVVLFHLIRHRFNVPFVVVPGALAWIACAFHTGMLVPLSASMKTVVYGGPSPEKTMALLSPFLPLPQFGTGERTLLENAAVLPILVMWFIPLFRRAWTYSLVPMLGAWLALLAIGGALACDWYLSPIVALLAAAASWTMISKRGAIYLVAVCPLLFAHGYQSAAQEARQMQKTWVDASTIAAVVEPGSLLTETAGIPSMFVRIVWDEVGIVTPRVAAIRRQVGDGWYSAVLDSMKPDALIVRPAWLRQNLPAGGTARPFADSTQMARFDSTYVSVADFIVDGRRTPSGWTALYLRRDFAVRKLGAVSGTVPDSAR